MQSFPSVYRFVADRLCRHHYLARDMKRLIAAIAFLFTASAALATSSNAVLIPAAGHLDGAGGTSFRSDIAIHNLRDTTQRVRLEWLPRSGSGQTTFTRTITILARDSAQSDDFVFGALSTEGLGAILVQPVKADDSDDLDAKLVVSSRIWSPKPGGGDGTVSQSFPPVPLSEIFSNQVAIGGVRRDDRFRLNVGIVNLDRLSPWRFRIHTEDVVSSEPVEIVVEPFSMQQIALPGGPTGGKLRVHVEVVPDPVGRLTLWLAYASVVDNVTGDSWSSIGINTFP
jgi:hypothetical protein